jgi:penicillin amidase
MKRVLRWLAGLFLLAVLAAAGAFYWYRQAVLPQLAGDVRVKGLSGPVDVVRDREGVPHIYARTEADAQFALGFAHAQDRLWQMEMNRRIVAGRMAEVLGPNAVGTDRFLRTLGVRRTAQAILPRLDEPTRRLLEAYAAGVNAYLATRKSPLPPEFLLTRAPEPEPWSAVDSIGWTLMMAWDLSGNWGSEILRMRLAQKGWSLKQIQEFLPPYRGDAQPATADYTALYRQLAKIGQQSAALWRELPGYVEGMGSNNWAVGPHRSLSGKPLLANDPHLGLSAPALWYFAHLSAPGLNVIGATLPGVPSVVLGRNDRIAWGFTNTYPDVQDLFIERINPENPDQYETPTGWADFAVVREVIKVKDGADVTLDVRTTRHGPVISDAISVAAQGAVPQGYALTFAWTALSADNLTVQATSRLNRARNWEEFMQAMKHFHSPQQNILYADVDGNIGFIAPAKVPVRKPENDLKGLFPAPGWDARYDWAGFIPFDELPRQFNPPQGFLATANEKVVADSYPHFLTFEWAPPYRADRIRERLLATPKHGLDSFAAIQADVKSLAVEQFLPFLTRIPAKGAEERRVQQMLASWGADMAADRTEPLIVTAWLRELSRLVYADELGPDLFLDYWDQRSVFMLGVLADKDGQSRWCDDIRTPARESCDALIERALSLALADLRNRYGDDMAQWRWGPAHEAHSEHRPFGRVDWLARWFDQRVPTPGDTFTVNAGRHSIRTERAPFTNHHAASLRAIYDFSNLENSRYMHSTGQSGNPFSPLYGSMTERWAGVQYIPMQTKREVVEEEALGVLRLRN